MLIYCSTIKRAWSIPFLQPSQIFNITGAMELLGKQCRIHCKTHITYIRGLVHFWETNVVAGSKRFWMQFWLRPLHHRRFLLATQLQDYSVNEGSPILETITLFSFWNCSFLRWIKVAIFISKDKCKSLHTYYYSDFAELESFRSIGVCGYGYWKG